MKQISEVISKWIEHYVSSAGMKGVVLGLSGGIDSSLVAALSVKALGQENVLGLILPCASAHCDEEDAKLIADHLGMSKVFKLQMASPFCSVRKMMTGLYREMSIFDNKKNMKERLMWANMTARLRMIALYDAAMAFEYLVIGTSNRSELMTGYLTKYGDGGVDFEPIGSLYKTEVFELAKELGLPQRIIDRTPSASLWIGQTDEADLGMTYEKLDTILKLLDDDIYYKKQIIDMVGEEQYLRVLDLISASDHKRNIPPCPSREELGPVVVQKQMAKRLDLEPMI